MAKNRCRLHKRVQLRVLLQLPRYCSIPLIIFGAVLPLEQGTKQYAHQLKKIQSQSKKRGGSLGGVSYKVAEFLAAQRTPAPFPSPRTTVALERTIAKKKYRLSTSRHYSQEKKPLQGSHFPRCNDAEGGGLRTDFTFTKLWIARFREEAPPPLLLHLSPRSCLKDFVGFPQDFQFVPHKCLSSSASVQKISNATLCIDLRVQRSTNSHRVKKDSPFQVALKLFVVFMFFFFLTSLDHWRRTSSNVNASFLTCRGE